MITAVNRTHQSYRACHLEQPSITQNNDNTSQSGQKMEITSLYRVSVVFEELWCGLCDVFMHHFLIVHRKERKRDNKS